MDNKSYNTPKVSIAVAVYKVADYIEQCARSLFEQTLDDLEIIFVDDASPDDSVAIIERTLQDYPKRQGQVKILHHAHNMDIFQTRKDGLDAATGEYFIYVDGDDWVEPNYAELLYDKAKSSGADVAVCDFYYYSPKGVDTISSAPNGEGENGERMRDDTLYGECFPTVWIRLVRRELYNEHNIVWPVSGMADDVVITFQVLYFAKKIVHVAMPLYYYRINPQSYVNNMIEDSIVKRYKGCVNNIEVVEGFMKREGIEKKYRDGLLMLKKTALERLFPLIYKPKYWWMYVNTYPEANWMLLTGKGNPKLKMKKRLRLLTILMGIYPVYMNIKYGDNKIKN